MLKARLALCVLLCALGFSLPAAAEDLEAQARRLISALGCKACHSLDHSGSILAPPLDGIGARMNLQQLKEALVAHGTNSEKPFMPSYATTPEEDLHVILQFLATKK